MQGVHHSNLNSIMRYVRPTIGMIFLSVCRTLFTWLPGCNIKPCLNGYQLLWLLVCDVTPLLSWLWGLDIRPHLAHPVVSVVTVS